MTAFAAGLIKHFDDTGIVLNILTIKMRSLFCGFILAAITFSLIVNGTL
jgi:hypothetical protein